jgi:phosphatidylglycerol:prolipoprotein diacylglycerol transferase
MPAFAFPQIDPVIFQIYGPIALRWYNLAYIIGLVGGLFYCRFLIKRFPELNLTKDQLDGFLSWIILAIIIGGRLGEIVFYPHESFLKDGWKILRVWEGGMSFHGAVIGVFAAFYFFSKKHNISIFNLGDCVTAAAPIGLFFGRISNFINDELYGRVTSVPWAVAFPSGGYLPRHPSQLYEAFLEGLLLFGCLYTAMFHLKALRKPGTISGLFLIGYSFSRALIEFFREPDGVIHLLNIPITTGQLLSLPMALAGIYLVWRGFLSDRE